MENFELVASGTQLLALFDTNKEQRASFVQSVLCSFEEGTVDPLAVHLQVKNMEQLIKMMNDNPQYKETVLAAAEKHGGKSFEYHNAKVEVKEVGTKYDFSQCGDTTLEKLQAIADEANKALKERQEFLKKAPTAGTQVLDEDTAELVTIYPPSKSSTTSVAVTLK